MSQNQITNTLPFEKIPTKILVNTDTGQAEVFAVGGIFGDEKIAEVGANNEWTVTDISNLTKKYNNKNGKNLTENQVEQIFLSKGVKQFNNERASIINDNSPVNTRTYLATKQNFVPGVIDPKTNIKAGQTTPTQPSPAPPASDPPLAPGPGVNPQETVSTGIENSSLTEYQPEEKAETKLNGGILVYPRDHGSSGYDFISIQPIEYKPQLNLGSLPEPTESGFSSLKTPSERLRQEVTTGPAIYLPMTPGISESNSVAWGQDSLNAVQLALGNKAMGIIGNPESLTKFETAIGNVKGILTTIGDLANSPGLKNYISAYFAGQAVQANLLGRSGIVINPNLELLFQGPKLRSFRYSFKFTPRDDREAKIIRAIIKTFKKTMAVRRNPQSIFLGVPSVYKLKYVYNSTNSERQDHPFLNKIKPCALTSFNVNYTPDGSYMTYQDGSLTSYSVDMQFDEIEPIYNDDIDNVDGSTMGY